MPRRAVKPVALPLLTPRASNTARAANTAHQPSQLVLPQLQPQSARAAPQRRPWPVHPDVVARQRAGAKILRERREAASLLIREREADKLRKRAAMRARRLAAKQQRIGAATRVQATMRGARARRRVELLRTSLRRDAAARLQALWRGHTVRTDAELLQQADQQAAAGLQALRTQASAVLRHNSWFLEKQLAQRMEAVQAAERAEAALAVTALLRSLSAAHAMRAAIARGDDAAAGWAASIVLQRAWREHLRVRVAAMARARARAEAPTPTALGPATRVHCKVDREISANDSGGSTSSSFRKHLRRASSPNILARNVHVLDTRARQHAPMNVLPMNRPVAHVHAQRQQPAIPQSE